MRKVFIFVFAFILITSLSAQTDFYPDTVKAGRFDTGKMWTFDNPPIDYLKEQYDISFDEAWFEDVRLSALRIPGCTASFVSADGLIMTNNHCAEWHRNSVEKEGENLEETGFYAAALEEERKAPRMYVDQLLFIEDVTGEIHSALSEGKTDEEKAELKSKKIEELQKRYAEETGLNCQIVSLYNGGKYSVYGYKRYTDVRLVFVPENQIAYFGGDYDNFTYPRYDLDCAFFRVYNENGKPLKTDHYFKFSEKGAEFNEPIFTVGNPGRTNRLKTVAQLKYYRDVVYKNRAFQYDTYYSLLENLKTVYPDRAEEFEKMKVRIGNAQKVIHYTYEGLKDPYLMARKEAFENNLKSAVMNDPDLKEKFGHVWKAIENIRKELTEIDSKIAAYSQRGRFVSAYFKIAEKLVDAAEELNKPEEKRAAQFKSDKMDSTFAAIFPKNFDKVLEDAKLQIQVDLIRMNLGDDDDLVQKLFGNYRSKEAAEYILSHSSITSKEEVITLAKQGADAIINSGDPFIYFILNTKDELDTLRKLSKEAGSTESVLNDMLGQAMFAVYGTTIPPDANFTLRISDGVLKSFPYNGTKAIERTTFFGLYDRYFGAKGKYPWSLPERWKTIPEDLDLSTPFNFISTNDIVGGNSGSAIINKDAEVVGLAFDGNVKSIIGNFIFMPRDNRTVGVASEGILEALKNVYKADRLFKELKNGKLAE